VGRGDLSPYVFGFALACILELLLAGWGTARKSRANRARFESDLRALRTEVARTAEVCTLTSTRAAAIGNAVPGAIKEVMSRLGSLQDRATELGDRLSEIAGRVEASSERVDVVTSHTQPINALTTEIADIK